MLFHRLRASAAFYSRVLALILIPGLVNAQLPDIDADGMPDDWEYAFGLSPSDPFDADLDFDFDGLTNLNEYLNSTHPHLPDSDFDSVPDGDDLFPADRTKALDSDQDGLPDAWELVNGLQPYDSFDAGLDDDYDGLTALEEYRSGTDINVHDTDGDGLPDGMDAFPNDAVYQQDSDEDGLPDKYENDHYFLNPYFPQDATEDSDWDGLTNLEEFQQGTDPDHPDSDLDGSMDGDDPAPADARYRWDTDQDGIPDEWELQYGGDPYFHDIWNDFDGDFLLSLEEYLAGTDPVDSDTDDDGVMDREDHYPLNPQYARDSDRDGMPYEYEMQYGMSDNFTEDGGFDFDGDLLNNSREFAKGTIPFFPDTDFDGVNDGLDLFPLDRTKALDSDQDGLPDAWEIINGLDHYYPFDANTDNDGDGLTVLQEYQLGTDIQNEDTDGDFHPDGMDVFPNDVMYQQDSDEDGLPNKYENDRYFLDPYFPQDAADDHDWDGLTNLEEFQQGTDPDNPDSDRDGSMDGDDPAPTDPQYRFDWDKDGLPDEWEQQYSGNPNDMDSWEDMDGDLLSNLEEYLAGTNPFDSDTDFDGVMDREDHYPLNPQYTRDSDRDGMPYEYEMRWGTSDNHTQDGGNDFDGDLLNNSREFTKGTIPFLPDTDFDGVNDGSDLFPLDRTKALDSDRDGLPDAWEIINGLDPYYHFDADRDDDYDGLTVLQEYRLGTSIESEDTDGDFHPDGMDVFPNDAAYHQDSDEDGLPDRYENDRSFLDPYFPQDATDDHDWDGLTNLQEFQQGTDSDHPDSDFDGGMDGEDPVPMDPQYTRDSDRDGMPDEWEDQNGTNRTLQDAIEDFDGDFLSNFEEYLARTDPFNRDSDLDGVMDREDHYPLNSQLTRDGDRDGIPYEYEMRWGMSDNYTDDGGFDFDGDLLNNSREFAKGTITVLPDTDFDGVNDSLDLFPLDRTKALDSDRDGLPDVWEILHGLDPFNNLDAEQDGDNDGLTVLQEFQRGTDIENEDTDGDFFPDGMDVFPTDAAYQQDSDNDGLPDRYENNRSFLDPYFPQDAADDYDWDGLTNLAEFQQGANPEDSDSDFDGGMDGEDPAPMDPQYTRDSDRDGMPDEWEDQNGTNRTWQDAIEDFDGDFLSNLEEYLAGTDPLNHDTDFDGVMDREDHYPSNQQYTRDGDRDGMPMEWEMQYGLNDSDPYDALEDLDWDGINNLEEFLAGSDPAGSGSVDTDGDGMPDNFEIQYGLDRLDANDGLPDGDNDGLSNVDEYLNNTDPTNSDSDGDGMPDGWEVSFGLSPADSSDASLDNDGDGLSAIEEYLHGTDPTNADSDGDSIIDGQDAFPNNPDETADTDGDGVGNNADLDDDNDGLSDSLELQLGSDPLNSDSDGDSVDDLQDTAILDPLFPIIYKYTGTISYPSDNLGTAIAVVGDVDFDGMFDFAISAPYDSVNPTWGVVNIISGADGSILRRTYAPESAQTNPYFGATVAGVGDINQDGYHEILIGAPNANAAYVYSGFDGTELLAINGDEEDYQLGYTVSGLGDIDQDAIPDFMVSLITDTSLYTQAVRVYSGASGAVIHEIEIAGSFAYYPPQIAGLRDVNGDGVPDLVIGASIEGSGKVFVYSGSDANVIYQLSADPGSPLYGRSLANAGDINNDGVDDIIVAARDDDTLGTNAGAVYIYSGLNGAVLHSLINNTAYEVFGQDVNTAGDVNGDGYADVIVSSRGNSGAFGGDQVDNHVHVFSGRDGLELLTFSQPFTPSLNTFYGYRVIGLGDINGDGLSEVAVSALYEGVGGAVYIYSLQGDNDSDGLPYIWEASYGLDNLDAGDASIDMDVDGLTNLQEYQIGTSPVNSDTDADGVNDAIDAFPLDGSETIDTDSDGEGDNADIDDDNDGVDDQSDAFPLDITEWSDNDTDGIGDNADTDDDNDGVLDENDIFPFDSTEWADSDSDGVGDNADAFPNDPGEISDADADGTGDNADPDDDNDSMSDSWEILYGFNPFDAGDADLDYDSDQYSNLREYQLNSDPLDIASPGSPFIYTDIVQGVSNTSWSMVTLERQYVSMVVVATPLYDQLYGPMVVRIRNAIDNSFEIKIDRADTSSSAVNVDVHYMVVEEGVYEQTTHGVTMEAVKYLSTLTDQNNSWVGQRRYYQNVYTTPVIIGQVMSANDADYSAFWSRGRSVGKIPDNSYLFVGKHVGEDPDSSRANETVAYIVIETGSGLLNEYRYEAAVGGDIVEGIQNGTGTYGLQTVTSPDTAILSQTAMDGSDGSWAILTATPAANSIYLAVDEDRMKDSERKHTTEQISYIAFER